MSDHTILFVAGATKPGHGGDLAAVEFRDLMGSLAHVVCLDPEPGGNLLSYVRHAAEIRKTRAKLRHGGRRPLVCINHPRFLLSTLLTRPVLLYHGIIGLRAVSVTQGPVSRVIARWLLWLATTFLILVCRHVLVVGNAMTDFHPAIRAHPRLTRVSNPMLPPRDDGSTREICATGRFVYIGRLSASKGIGGLLALFKAADLGPRLLVIGEGPMRPEVTESAAWGVVHLPHCTPAEIARLLEGSLGFVSMSPNETFCRPIFEAAVAGRPSFVRHWAGSSAWLDDLQFVNEIPADPASLGALVDALLGQPKNLAFSAEANAFLAGERARFLDCLTTILHAG